ncbi:ROK family protein [Paenibacillus sp. OV219]|uniref:ROK family protein n=1 Tax=Paenibacillus sp. OV219 TaxID=1884377 RepID=UPI0008D15B71|nr:ROK family protein [Paenibacillus sp. OV219]SEO54562.1 glucokinase [Paenibacillus sp. OV219]
MSRDVILAFDVGGTQIKAAAMREGEIIASTVGHYDSRSELGADAIIAHFVAIAVDVLGREGLSEEQIVGFGLAFPGPFDYEQGVCLIQGLGKFESLYGLNIGDMLDDAIRSHAQLSRRLSSKFHIVFENDAALFGLGEANNSGEALDVERAVCLTIGTGLGSCYLERGQLVKHRSGVPENGWLYAQPYGNRIADECISRRGVLQLAEEMGMELAGRDVRELADAAASGDAAAVQLFDHFGRRMAVILGPAFQAYEPNRIVLGGQISKSADLFAPAFKEGLLAQGIIAQVRVSTDTFASTFRGIYHLVK